jgi:hypothetical protein
MAVKSESQNKWTDVGRIQDIVRGLVWLSCLLLMMALYNASLSKSYKPRASSLGLNKIKSRERDIFL